MKRIIKEIIPDSATKLKELLDLPKLGKYSSIKNIKAIHIKALLNDAFTNAFRNFIIF